MSQGNYNIQLSNLNLNQPLLGTNSYSQINTTDTTQVIVDKPTKQRNKEKATINPELARFPFCIVWTPLPLISWLLPFIGHTGIAMSNGVIHDFAGPYYISVDDLAFGETHK